MDDKKIIKKIFCAGCQSEQGHELSASQTGEIIATCVACGRILKFPAGISRKEFDKNIEKHSEQNAGQVSVDSINETLSKLVD
jgi:hypothetical protein